SVSLFLFDTDSGLLPLVILPSLFYFSFSLAPRAARASLFPYTTLFRSAHIYVLCYNIVALIFHCFTHVGNFNLCIIIRQAVEDRSEEHTSELQSRFDLVCRLLLEKK